MQPQQDLGLGLEDPGHSQGLGLAAGLPDLMSGQPLVGVDTTLGHQDGKLLLEEVELDVPMFLHSDVLGTLEGTLEYTILKLALKYYRLVQAFFNTTR